MFRLMKLAAYALFGYALYEFFRGMSADMGGESGGRSMGQQSGRAMAGGGSGEGQLTGPGEGRDEATMDSDGGTVRHRVGRGVIRTGM